VGGNAQKMGLNRVFGAWGFSVVLGNGNTQLVAGLSYVWDPQTLKLRFINATSESNAAATITQNSVITMWVAGV
jgi:hypothetical protein